MCFNGKAKCFFACTDLFSDDELKVYDLNWKRIPFTRHYQASEEDFEEPKQYEKMLNFSEILAKDTTLIRTDFYEIDGELYFGELTFYPGSGFEEFSPEEWDLKLDSWLRLPNEESGN